MTGKRLEPTAAQLEREAYGTVAEAMAEAYGSPGAAEAERWPAQASAEPPAEPPPARRSTEAAGGHDRQARKQATRKQRERGATVYLKAEELLKAGIDPEGPPPFYRVWGAPRGRVVIQLYRTR